MYTTQGHVNKTCRVLANDWCFQQLAYNIKALLNYCPICNNWLWIHGLGIFFKFYSSQGGHEGLSPRLVCGGARETSIEVIGQSRLVCKLGWHKVEQQFPTCFIAPDIFLYS